MHKIIFLDRDGVINEESRLFIKHPDEWQAIPGSMEAIAMLTKANWRIGVATNQSGIDRQLFSVSDLEKIHEKMLHTVAAFGGKIDKICYCPHLPTANCSCRKPQPGMIKELLEFFAVKEPQGIRFVGDSLSDIDLALNTGCIPTLVRSGDGLDTLAKLSPLQVKKTEIYDNLLSVVQHMLQ
jgi:D-glycero-D-manno-heptose 1,7-bisphosphate phosphatase